MRRRRAPAERRRACIEVDDTTAALQELAHAIRRESGARVVAITGSAGKTTTKEVTREFLAARYRVVRNRGNLNNHIGLPLSLLELRQRPDVAVVELGMNHAGEISTLVGSPSRRCASGPTSARRTSASSGRSTRSPMRRRRSSRAPARRRVLVANADDARSCARARGFAGRVVTFGIDRDADVRATDVEDRGLDGTQRARHDAARRAST